MGIRIGDALPRASLQASHGKEAARHLVAGHGPRRRDRTVQGILFDEPPDCFRDQPTKILFFIHHRPPSIRSRTVNNLVCDFMPHPAFRFHHRSALAHRRIGRRHWGSHLRRGIRPKTWDTRLTADNDLELSPRSSGPWSIF